MFLQIKSHLHIKRIKYHHKWKFNCTMHTAVLQWFFWKFIYIIIEILCLSLNLFVTDFKNLCSVKTYFCMKWNKFSWRSTSVFLSVKFYLFIQMEPWIHFKWKTNPLFARYILNTHVHRSLFILIKRIWKTN